MRFLTASQRFGMTRCYVVVEGLDGDEAATKPLPFEIL
jgi:hypothetical protein